MDGIDPDDGHEAPEAVRGSSRRPDPVPFIIRTQGAGRGAEAVSMSRCRWVGRRCSLGVGRSPGATEPARSSRRRRRGSDLRRVAARERGRGPQALGEQPRGRAADAKAPSRAGHRPRPAHRQGGDQDDHVGREVRDPEGGDRARGQGRPEGHRPLHRDARGRHEVRQLARPRRAGHVHDRRPAR